jgi:hypothetical protein
MRRREDTRPDELKELLKSNPNAQKSWDRLSAGERRALVLFVAAAKKARHACAGRDGSSAVDPTVRSLIEIDGLSPNAEIGLERQAGTALSGRHAMAVAKSFGLYWQCSGEKPPGN